MSIFDYNPNAKPGTLGGIQNNVASAANLGANIGGRIRSLFTNPGANFQPMTNNSAAPGVSNSPSGVIGATDAPGPASSMSSTNSAFMAANPQFSQPQAETATAPTQNPVQTFAQPHTDANSGLPYYLGGDTLPTIGSDEYNRVKSITNNPSTVSYSIPTNQSYGSSSFAPATTNDALTARNQAANNMSTGTGGYMPSTGYLQDYMKQYGNAASDYVSTAAALNSERLAQLHQVGEIYNQSGIGSAGRDEAINAINTRYGNTVSQLEVGNQAAGVNMDAASRFYSTFLKPQEISPGSSLMTPQGEVVGQATGAAPAQIMSTALQLYQAAQTSGTATYNADGSPNLAPFIQQAQQYYGGGAGAMGGASGGQPAQTPGAGGMPPQLATYLQASGGSIINEDKVPTNQRDTIKMLAAQNGIPYLTGGDLDKYQSILVTKENLGNMNQVAQNILSSGLGGRTVGAAWNTISGALQLNPDISSFRAWRDTAVNTIQALAGGQGSGFRLNQAEINLAANNLPTITDNLETAQAKMSIVNSMLDRWQNQILRGNPTNSGTTSTGSSGASNNSSLWNW